MRIALISMAGTGAGEVRLAGHPLAWHQVQAVLALACERIVCLADAPGPSLAALQRETEARGASFHAIAHHRALAGLVHAADTLVVLAPGILPEREWLVQAFGARAGVAVLPADNAVEQGFERIDRERAWAGVLATRGDAVEALASLPPDADPISGLLRVALQRGATAVAVPEAWLDDDRWALVASAPAARRYQTGWYLRHVPPPSLLQPGRAAAYRLARRLVEGSANARRTAAGLYASGTVVALGSALSGYWGHTAGAVTGLALASMMLATGAAVGRLARAGSGDEQAGWPREARGALLDVSLTVIAASPSAFAGWTTAFAALVLVAVVRLAQEAEAVGPFPAWSDRNLMLALLALLAAAGVFAPGLAALSLAGLGLKLFWPRSPRG